MLKSKKFWIITAVILLAGGFWGYSRYKKANQPPDYELATVQKGNLSQTVEATGKIESVNDLSLRFETAGTLDAVNVKEGQTVKTGQVLASLKLSELNAAVAAASANLNQKLAGATKEDIKYYEAAMAAAKAAYEQSKIDAANSVASAEAALETAKNNLKLAEGGENSQIVSHVYEDTVALLLSTLSVLDNTLSQADNILGIDNTLANDSFETLLAITNPGLLPIANNQYSAAKAEKNIARTKILPLTALSSRTDVDAALAEAETALIKMNQLLVAVADVLNATLSGNNLTQTALETKKSTIETTRSAVTTNYTSIINQKQTIADAKNSYSTYKIAYDKALRDLNDAKSLQVTTVATKEAAYNQAVANLQSKTNAPREVDVAYYRAALSQAIANRDKAVLKAPIDGVVTKVNKKRGEFVSMSDVAIQLLSPHYEIEVDIPETDVSKIKVNDQASITLDAFGEDVKFTGKIINIEPASTEVQDVVYYRIRVTLDDTKEDVKPGMTANVAISTATRENILFIPARAVRTGTEGKFVRVLKNGKEINRPVVLGMKGDNGLTEILEGLKEGEQVIVSIRTPAK